MSLPLSTLSVRQRNLAVGSSPSARAERSRLLATRFIEQHGALHCLQEAVSFLQEGAPHGTRLLDGVVEIPISDVNIVGRTPLPSPYGVKGGAAREHLLPVLNVRNAREPRDIDLIRMGSFAIPSDDEMARRFMPQDYQHGARVELIRDTRRYFSTRDITINEVAVFSPVARASVLAALDSVGHVIRPSRYRGGSIHRMPSLDGRVLLKMVRLAAEAERFGEPALMVGIPDEVSFSEFDIAVHLNKAFQRDETVASNFVNILTVLGALPASGEPLQELLANVAHLRHGEKGLLPDVPSDLWADID